MLPEEHDEQAMREVAEKKKAVMREVVSWVKVFAVAVALALFIGLVVIVNAQVPTSSMEDTIMPGDRIIALRLSVRQAEAMCKRMAAEQPVEPEPKKQPAPVDYVGECEKQLTHCLGRKVRIICGKRKGRFELDFYGQDDLQRLYEALQQLNIPEEPND